MVSLTNNSYFQQIQANRSIDEVFEDTCKALQPLLREEITATSTESNGTRKVDLGKPIVFVLGMTFLGSKYFQTLPALNLAL